MGKRKKFDFTILMNFERLNSHAVYNLDIPEEKKNDFYSNFVYNDNFKPVLLNFVDVSFIAEEDKANGVMVEISNNFLTEEGVKNLIKDSKSGNIATLEHFINEHDLNGWTTISGLKVKSFRKVLTNQVSPYEFSKDGIEIERVGEPEKKKKSNPAQMGE